MFNIKREKNVEWFFLKYEGMFGRYIEMQRESGQSRTCSDSNKHDKENMTLRSSVTAGNRDAGHRHDLNYPCRTGSLHSSSLNGTLRLRFYPSAVILPPSRGTVGKPTPSANLKSTISRSSQEMLLPQHLPMVRARERSLSKGNSSAVRFVP